MLEFINSKIILSNKIQFNKVYQFFIKIMIKALVCPTEKLTNNEYSTICYDIVFNVFWTLFNYTKNIKLTMFLCDRSIDLFNEYMEMILAALNSNLLSQNKIKIKPTDIKLFIYNKTIGPITFQKMERLKGVTKLRIRQCKSACMIIQIILKDVFNVYYKNKIDNNGKDLYNFSYQRKKLTEIEDIFENITDNISNTIYVLHTKSFGDCVDNVIYNELEVLKIDKNIPRFSLMIYRKLSIMLHLVRKNKNINSNGLDSIFSLLLKNQLFQLDKNINSFEKRKNLDSSIRSLCKDAYKLSKKNISLSASD
tara:strand:- start:686 stop:1612 length:927 start_codon:yes stop_codon:yes gene_type:complete